MTSSSNAELKFYAGNYGIDYYGIMDPYVYDEDGVGTDPASFDEQWDVTRVKINDELMDDDGLSSRNRREVVIHEVGHALGLMHQPDGTPTSIMEETDLRERTNPGSLDIANLQWKY